MRFHHYLGFERGVELYRDGYADEHSRCAERARTCVRRKNKVKHYRRDKRKYRKEYRSEKRKSVVYLFKIVRSGFTGSDTGDKSAVLLNRFGNIFGVELYLRVEEREEYDEQAESDRVERISRIRAEPCAPPRRTFGPADESEYKFGERKYRKREDERHNAVGVDLYRNNGRLSAVHLVALYLFGVLNGYLSFGKFHPYDRAEYDDDYKEITHESEQFYSRGRIETSAEDRRAFLYEELSGRRDDTREDKQRYTVGNAVIGYSFADPHRYAGTCRIEEYHYNVGKELRKSGNVICAARKKSYELAVRTRYAAVTY